jgi:hypothetical protein
VAIRPRWPVLDAHLSWDKWARTDSRLGLLTQHAQHTRTSPVTGTVFHLTTYNRTIILDSADAWCVLIVGWTLNPLGHHILASASNPLLPVITRLPTIFFLMFPTSRFCLSFITLNYTIINNLLFCVFLLLNLVRVLLL